MQVFANEITLPKTKLETEWIDGFPVQKAMPTREYGVMQRVLSAALNEWGSGRGQVSTEWGFRVDASDKAVHPLVPDVAFMSFERLRSLPKDERSYPIIAPEIVVEILPPSDKPKVVETKRKEYLACGVSLLLLVNYEKRSAKHTTARADIPRSAAPRFTRR